MEELEKVYDINDEIIMKSNPQKQPDLTPEAEVDMLDAEQTFPTEEEIALEVFPFANIKNPA